MLENSLIAMNNCPNANAKAVLQRVIFLHCLSLVRKEQAWYLINGVINPQAAAELDAQHDAAVKALAPRINDCVEALGVPNIKELHGPIARDYVAFNAQDDNENYASAGEMFDFKTTGTMRAKL